MVALMDLEKVELALREVERIEKCLEEPVGAVPRVCIEGTEGWESCGGEEGV